MIFNPELPIGLSETFSGVYCCLKYFTTKSCSYPPLPHHRYGQVNKTHGPPGTVLLPSTWSHGLLGPGKGMIHTAHPRSVPLRSTQEPEWLRPGKYTKCRVHLGQCPCRTPWRMSSVDPGSTCHLRPRPNPVWSIHCEHSPHMPVVFVCSVPPHQQDN